MPCRVVEPLERRTLLSLTVQLDYRFDVNNLFDTPAKRAVLQSAVDAAVSHYGDHLSAITPSVGNTWHAVITDPGHGGSADIANLTVPADTLIVFVGGQNISALGVGGPGGFTSSGSDDWNTLVATRGEGDTSGADAVDFGPYGGSITFDTSPGGGWYFGTDPAGINGKNDFYSVAMHEMTHVLGFGTSDSWNARVNASGAFTGPSAVANYDGPGNVPLDADHAHWASGTSDGGVETAMDPELTTGTRKVLTPLDLAGMDDIGWEIPLGASLAAVPTINTAGGAAATLSVTYTHYTDIDAATISSNDLSIAGPHNFKATATLTGVAPATSSASGTSVVATYSLAAPGGTFDSADSGAYTVSTVRGSVGDAFGNSVAAGSVGTFTVDIDAPPMVTFAAQNVFQIGGAEHTFTATYTDDDGIDATTFDAGDVTVTRNSDGLALAVIGVTPDGAAAGSSPRTVTYTVAAPGGAWDPDDNGTYTAALNPHQVVDLQGTPAEPATLGTFDVTIGVLTFAAGHNATYTDASGDAVVVALKGPGSGQVLFDAPGNADAGEIVLNDSTAASALTITAATKGDGTSIGAVTVNGSMKSFTAKNADLGGAMAVSGTLPKLQFRNASGSIQLNGGAPASIVLGQARDLSLTLAAGLKSLKATEWLDTDATPDLITTPTLTSLAVNGAFQASITAGAIGKITIAGELAGAEIRATQSIAALTVGSIRSSLVFAGVTGSNLPDSPDDFADATTPLRAFTIKSKTAGAFSDTRISAAQLGKVSLGSIVTTNSGIPLGVAALAIKSVSGITDAGAAIKAAKLDDPAGSQTAGDFVLRLV